MTFRGAIQRTARRRHYNLRDPKDASVRSIPLSAGPGRLGLLTAGLLLAGCTLGQRPPQAPVCTLIGCGNTLEVRLVGAHVPTDFTLTLDAASGEHVRVRCTEGTAEFEPPEAARWTPACPAGGVSFFNFAPQGISVAVEWADGQVVQELEPRYATSQPNGPECEPTCRSGAVEVIIPEFPAYGAESTWAVYSDEAHGFRLRYPAQLGLKRETDLYGQTVATVGDRIEIRAGGRDPLVCVGDCPLIEENKPQPLAGRAARQVRGYIGSIGGSVPQYYLMYAVRLGEVHVSFVLYAAGRAAVTDDPTYIRELAQEDIDLFERIMRSVEFGP